MAANFVFYCIRIKLGLAEETTLTQCIKLKYESQIDDSSMFNI
jgi:hypothetical protein